MQASETQFSSFLSKSGTKFIIPVYQRNYDWKQKQCSQLLADLDSVSKADSPYFIGSIVHQSTRNLTNNTELIIIDGQQRITTITLLLYVLSRRFKEFGDEQKAEQIEEIYLFNKYDSNKNKLKLKPVNEDDIALQNIIQGNLDQVENGHRIRENYEYFANRIPSINEANLYYEAFPKLTIVEISLDERDDPQKIFQSLNSTGLELSQADLIRNYILMNLEYDLQEKFYNQYWSVIEKNCRNQNTFESELSWFIRDYLTYKYNKIPAKANIYEDFVERHPNITHDTIELEGVLEDLKSYSKIYSYLINEDNPFSEEVKRELININKLEVSVAYPFLLGVLNDVEKGEISESSLKNILKLTQTFVIRRFICDLPSNALQKIFMTMYTNAKKYHKRHPENSFDDAVSVVLMKLSSYQRFPTDEDVRLNLEVKDIYRAQRRKRNYLLENIENQYSNFNEQYIDLEAREDITIEHIFPQNPGKEYLEQLGQDQFEKMNTLANTLGNLSLVINNSSLGNKSFIYKRDLNNEESKGFKYSKFNLNETLKDLEKWDLQELSNRRDKLIDKVLDIWKYPDVKLEEYILVESEPISLESIENPTGTKPKAVFIDGSKRVVTSNREMYTFIIEYIYEKEPEVFFKPVIIEALGISDDSNKYMAYEKIDKQFYDTGISAYRLYARLKKLLETVEDDYEILVQLREDKE